MMRHAKALRCWISICVAGQRVLVFPEQGRGDMIQFARYLPLLAARGAHVLVEMYAELKPLFETIDGVEQGGDARCGDAGP